MVEFALPVGANCENIHAVLSDVGDFLPLIFLGNNQVGNARLLNGMHTLGKRLMHIQFAPHAVEVVRGHTNNQVISQGLRTAQKSLVPVMEHVIRAIRYNDFLTVSHGLSLRHCAHCRDSLLRFRRRKTAPYSYSCSAGSIPQRRRTGLYLLFLLRNQDCTCHRHIGNAYSLERLIDLRA